MSSIKNFEDLVCWQEARVLVKDVYFLSNRGRLEKDFDTKSQLRRAALSVMIILQKVLVDIVKMILGRFLEISKGSLYEVKSMLYILEDIEYFKKDELISLYERIDKIEKILKGLINKLSNQ